MKYTVKALDISSSIVFAIHTLKTVTCLNTIAQKHETKQLILPREFSCNVSIHWYISINLKSA